MSGANLFASLIAVALIADACVTQRSGAATLTAEEVRARFDAGRTIFLDARRPDEFARGHIAGALNLPAEEFTARYAALAPMLPREADIVIYCGGQDGNLGGLLAQRLHNAGFKQVRVFKGGWFTWHQRGWPGER